MASFYSTIYATSSPCLAEALALRQALLCWDLQFAKAIFEGDYLKLIMEVKSPTRSSCELYYVLHDIRVLLNQAQGRSLLFCYHEANSASHSLAKIACNLGEDCVWMEDYPSHIESVLANKLCLITVDEGISVCFIFKEKPNGI